MSLVFSEHETGENLRVENEASGVILTQDLGAARLVLSHTEALWLMAVALPHLLSTSQTTWTTTADEGHPMASLARLTERDDLA